MQDNNNSALHLPNTPPSKISHLIRREFKFYGVFLSVEGRFKRALDDIIVSEARRRCTNLIVDCYHAVTNGMQVTVTLIKSKRNFFD